MLLNASVSIPVWRVEPWKMLNRSSSSSMSRSMALELTKLGTDDDVDWLRVELEECSARIAELGKCCDDSADFDSPEE